MILLKLAFDELKDTQSKLIFTNYQALDWF